jgi:FtsP/CotA-like multicopper oxidase with cupredoxin domain
VPGPTIVCEQGKELVLELTNKLKQQPAQDTYTRVANQFRHPDLTNLHTHGMHISPHGHTTSNTSDNVLLVVQPADWSGTGLPGQSRTYRYQVPADHMPGTLWIHPHVHGSSAIQVGGGAAFALLIKDPPDYLPAQVAAAPDKVMVVQYLVGGMNRFESLNTIARESGDHEFKLERNLDFKTVPGAKGKCSHSTTVSNKSYKWSEAILDPNRVPPKQSECAADFHTLNGQIQPVLTLEQGKWERWRFINAGWTLERLALTINDKNGETCDIELLAKDSIYIRNFPR